MQLSKEVEMVFSCCLALKQNLVKIRNNFNTSQSEIHLPQLKPLICHNLKNLLVTFSLFYDEVPCHIETSLLICRVNQWTGFSMIGTSVMKELIVWCLMIAWSQHLIVDPGTISFKILKKSSIPSWWKLVLQLAMTANNSNYDNNNFVSLPEYIL